jgi:chromosome segregation ATPase
MSDVDFVNVYMGKLKDHLNDQLTKIIMLETHLELAGNSAKSLGAELEHEREAKEELIKTNEDLMDRLSKLESKHKDTQSKSEQAIAERDALRINVDDLNAEVNRLRSFEAENQQIASLKSQINTLNMEVESAKFREQSITDDYAKLVNEHQALKDKYKETKAPVVPATPIKKK